MTPLSPGRKHSKLQSNATAAPVRIVAGKSQWWLSVHSNKRAICGTANPIKAPVPQKAVVIAVRIPVTTSRKLRVRCVLMPRFSAYCSPKSKAFKGFIIKREAVRPKMTTEAKRGMWAMETPPKFPNPHTK